MSRRSSKQGDDRRGRCDGGRGGGRHPGHGLGEARPPKPKIVKVADDYYSPTTLTVHKGASIRWAWSYSNFDTHNVRLKRGAARGEEVASSRSPTGAVGIHFQRKLTTPGTYKFVCTLHRHRDADAGHRQALRRR